MLLKHCGVQTQTLMHFYSLLVPLLMLLLQLEANFPFFSHSFTSLHILKPHFAVVNT